MVNNSDFVQRLQKVMDYYGLNASAFADTLEVQRSSISHLLSERNKPSLDFILKLVSKFPEIDIFWITQGKGEFPTPSEKSKITENKSFQTDLFENAKSETIVTPPTIIKKEEFQNPLEDSKSFDQIQKYSPKIKKIIFFYEDNSFEVFENE